MADSDLFYVSRSGDVLDQIVFNHYGDTDDLKVEAVLEANRGLADLGPVLGEGIRILLPDLSGAQPVETEQLWG